jgi:hypothetical protein
VEKHIQKKQLEEVTIFQESQGMSKEYLTETAKQAYGSRNKNGKLWLAQEGQAQSTVIALIGMSFIPCKRSWGHTLLHQAPTDGVGRVLADHHYCLRVFTIAR